MAFGLFGPYGFWIFGPSWIRFTIQKTRKYFIETKILTKFQFQSVGEKVQSRKKINLHKIKLKLCKRKIFS